MLITELHRRMHETRDLRGWSLRANHDTRRAFAHEAMGTLNSDQRRHPQLVVRHRTCGSVLWRVFNTHWGPLAVPPRATASSVIVLLDVEPETQLTASCNVCRTPVTRPRAELLKAATAARGGGPQSIKIA